MGKNTLWIWPNNQILTEINLNIIYRYDHKELQIKILGKISIPVAQINFFCCAFSFQKCQVSQFVTSLLVTSVVTDHLSLKSKMNRPSLLKWECNILLKRFGRCLLDNNTCDSHNSHIMYDDDCLTESSFNLQCKKIKLWNRKVTLLKS